MGIKMTTNSTFTLETFASAPWGDEPDAVTLALEDFPQFGEMSSEQIRKVRVPVRIRLDSLGGLHALADASLRTSNSAPVFIHHFNAEGKLAAKTMVVSPDESDTDDLFILDYAVDTEGSCYLLEQIRSGQLGQAKNRLQKISKEGRVQWSRTGPVSKQEFDFHELEGTFKRLLMDGRSCLYLPATEHAGAIAEIDRNTGEVVHVYMSDKFGGEVFMNERGTVIYVLYFPDINRRGLGFFDLADQKVRYVVGGSELYGWLLYPIGVDSLSNVYAWSGSALAGISSDGRFDVITALDNVVVRSRDGVIFTSRQCLDNEQSPVVRVARYLPAGESSYQDLHLPEKLIARHGWGWKIIYVDEREKFYLFGGEAPGQVGTLLIYSSNGDLETTTFPPPDLLLMESRLESYSFWDVDSRGRIYLPVTDAQGFKVIRLSCYKEEGRSEQRSQELLKQEEPMTTFPGSPRITERR